MLVFVLVFVPVLVFVSVFVLVAVPVVADVVAGVTVAGEVCPVVVGVEVLPVSSAAPAAEVTWLTAEFTTDTAPPTTTETVSELVSLEERLFAVEVGAVVLKNGPTCLLISLGK